MMNRLKISAAEQDLVLFLLDQVPFKKYTSGEQMILAAHLAYTLRKARERRESAKPTTRKRK